MQIPPDLVLPSFVDLKDADGHFIESLVIFTDQYHRRLLLV
jgi:hypothetical protein